MVSLDLLRQIRVFRGLNQEEFEVVLGLTSVWECAKNQYVFKEGDVSDVLYIVADGEVAVIISTGLLVNHTVATFTRGDVFGELAFIDPSPRTATIRCTQPTQLISITRDDFRHLASKHPNIQRIVYKNLSRILSERLRNANEKLKELAGKDRHLAPALPMFFTV